MASEGAKPAPNPSANFPRLERPTGQVDFFSPRPPDQVIPTTALTRFDVRAEQYLQNRRFIIDLVIKRDPIPGFSSFERKWDPQATVDAFYWSNGEYHPLWGEFIYSIPGQAPNPPWHSVSSNADFGRASSFSGSQEYVEWKLRPDSLEPGSTAMFIVTMTVNGYDLGFEDRGGGYQIDDDHRLYRFCKW